MPGRGGGAKGGSGKSGGGSKPSGGKINRSAITGRFVTDATVKRHPDKTVRESR